MKKLWLLSIPILYLTAFESNLYASSSRALITYSSSKPTTYSSSKPTTYGSGQPAAITAPQQGAIPQNTKGPLTPTTQKRTAMQYIKDALTNLTDSVKNQRTTTNVDGSTRVEISNKLNGDLLKVKTVNQDGTYKIKNANDGLTMEYGKTGGESTRIHRDKQGHRESAVTYDQNNRTGSSTSYQRDVSNNNRPTGYTTQSWNNNTIVEQGKIDYSTGKAVTSIHRVDYSTGTPIIKTTMHEGLITPSNQNSLSTPNPTVKTSALKPTQTIQPKAPTAAASEAYVAKSSSPKFVNTRPDGLGIGGAPTWMVLDYYGA